MRPARTLAVAESTASLELQFVTHSGDTIRRSWLVRLVIGYQRAVEGRPSPCRFTPTCSSYAIEALTRHGTLRGFFLTLRRFWQCRPFGPSGWDPVPDALTRKHVASS